MSFNISKQITSLFHVPTTNNHLIRRSKEKVVVVMGATGTGKSRLSVDLAIRFGAEVINSDKMQVYQGLDLTTNKITDEERCGVPHHLLGIIDPEKDFSAETFRGMALVSIKSILHRRKLPIIVGGSNSFIEALVDANFRSKYECCFLWVDVEMPILHSFISHRVDKMIERGMVNEVREFYNPGGDYTKGIRRAIGVPEFDIFLRTESFCNKETHARILKETTDLIKMNTNILAQRQLEKIYRLKNMGWRMHHLDATDVFRKCGDEANVTWDIMVAGLGAALVTRFLCNLESTSHDNVTEMKQHQITTIY